MDVVRFLESTWDLRVCETPEFIYDDMESQSGECLPLIHLPFDAGNRGHRADRGALHDFLHATGGEGRRLLDFGPGDGWPSLIVAPFAAEVVGPESTPSSVQQ
jgi:hypothetical protein